MKQNIVLLSFCVLLISSCTGQASNHVQKNTVAIPALSQMRYILHKAETRGESKTSWLLSKHTFSFNNYFDRNRVGFGALLVLNDDWVKGGAGFGTHHHEEMEIISIPLYGGVAHKDSKGASGITSFNKDKGTYTVQQMTAGTGILHSEYNVDPKDSVRFLQIWVQPNKKGLPPAYQQKEFLLSNQHNKWQVIIAPDDPSALFINQQAVFCLVDLDAGKSLKYSTKYGGGVYTFIIEGNATINGIALDRRDGIGILNSKDISVYARGNTKILLMEVPEK